MNVIAMHSRVGTYITFDRWNSSLGSILSQAIFQERQAGGNNECTITILTPIAVCVRHLGEILVKLILLNFGILVSLSSFC